MDIITYFFEWLGTTMREFGSSKLPGVAAWVEPWAVSLGLLYITIWAVMMAFGMVQQPLQEGIRRILTVAVVLACATRLALYNEVIVDLFTNGATEFASVLMGGTSVIALAQQIWVDGIATATSFWQRAGVTDMGGYLLAIGLVAVLIVVVGSMCALLAVAVIMTYGLIPLGPFFIVALLFSFTRRLFESFISQLANYFFITVLAGVFGSMLLYVVAKFAAGLSASGDAVTLSQCAGFALMAVLTWIVMKNIPSVAAGLSGGFALSTFSAVSRGLAWGLGTTQQAGRGVVEGALRIPVTKHDSAARIGGNLLGRGMAAPFGGSPRQGGTVSRDRVMPPRLVR
jgi:type IV secretion system protein VirB6